MLDYPTNMVLYGENFVLNFYAEMFLDCFYVECYNYEMTGCLEKCSVFE